MKVDDVFVWHLRDLVFITDVEGVRRDALIQVLIQREEGFDGDPWRVICSGIYRGLGLNPREARSTKRFELIDRLMSDEAEAVVTVDLTRRNVTPIKHKLMEIE